MKVLLSIKPEFAEKIFNGTKKYEFRKRIFKYSKVDAVVVYVSAPVQRIVGEFSIKSILEGDVDLIWYQTREFSGISDEFYKAYFAGKETAYAIEIGNVVRYSDSRRLSDYGISCPPQSYMYL